MMGGVREAAHLKGMLLRPTYRAIEQKRIYTLIEDCGR